MRLRPLPPALQSSREGARRAAHGPWLEATLLWCGDPLRVIHVAPRATLTAADLDVPETEGADLSAPLVLPAALGERTVTELGALTLRLALVEGAPPPARRRPEPAPLLGTLSSILAHALAALVLLWGHAAAGAQDDVVTGDQVHVMRRYLEASDGRDLPPREGPALGAGPLTEGTPGGTGTRARGEEGRMGVAGPHLPRYALAGDARAARRVDRDNALLEARDFGIIGVIAAPEQGGGPAWTDPVDARGGLWGGDLGDAMGTGGLGLSGTGEEGGGRGAGVGLGAIGTVGHGRGSGSAMESGAGGVGGTCDDSCVGGNLGHGSGTGVAVRWHRVGAVVTCAADGTGGCATSVSGRLPPEVIQRVVRQSFGRFRYCYESALRRNPSAAGRVTTRFVIARDGSVGAVTGASSDLAPDVVGCVQNAFGSLSFPQPAGGVVTVTYPITFTPD